MSKIRQNLFILIEPSDNKWNISSRACKMCLNQFCIDEDAAVELSGVSHLKGWSYECAWTFEQQKIAKGKEYFLAIFSIIFSI